MQGVKNWFEADPTRAFSAIRIVFYIAITLSAGAALDWEYILELIGTMLGVTAVDLITTGKTREKTEAPGTLDVALQMGSYGEVGAFAVRTVKGLVATFVPGASVAKALELILPHVAPFAGAVLTPKIQQDLTAMIHKTLRGANLLRRVDLE